MTAMILPGTYIEVRPEGLIAPGQVTVGNVGVVGTASKGELNKPILLSNYSDATSVFGSYDAFLDGANPPAPRADALTLVRALELVFANGASTVYAVRVAGSSQKAAEYTLPAVTANKTAAKLTARSGGTSGNDIAVNVDAADIDPLISKEEHVGPGPTALKYSPVIKSSRNRLILVSGGITRDLKILYDPGDAAAPATGEAKIKLSDGTVALGDAITAADKVYATYVVDRSKAAKVTVEAGSASEVYTVLSGTGLVAAINSVTAPSSLVKATAGDQPADLPKATSPSKAFVSFSGGDDGATGADYKTGLKALLDVDAHIIVAAGQDDGIGADLDAHCQEASTDVFKRDRIGVVGSAAAGNNVHAFIDKLIGNKLASDRLVFVAPGFVTNSTAKADSDFNPVTLPGAYTAAVIAGKLAGLPPHVSLTNKSIPVRDVEVTFSDPQLTALVQNRVTALEVSRGIRVLRGQTTDDGPFREITTRRIVDYAKYGVRSAAGPYIGLLNNDRVRGALRGTINSFLQGMLDDEMLVAYKLDVSATRDEQIKGIVQVTISLQPVFSINFIRVTMTLS